MGKKFVIVIAEDVEIIFEQTKRGIIKKGIDAEIIQTKNGDDAIRTILDRKPALIILNNRIKGTSGLGILKYFKRNKLKLPTTIMSTGDWHIEQECIEFGVYRFFKKPYIYNRLIDTVEEIYLKTAG